MSAGIDAGGGGDEAEMAMGAAARATGPRILLRRRDSGAPPDGDASAPPTISFDFDLPRDCTRSGNAPWCEP